MITPFSTDATVLPGADPGVVDFWETEPARFWLGKPGAMIELPDVLVDGHTVTSSYGETEAARYGGSSVDRWSERARRWVIPFLRYSGRSRGVVEMFQHGMPPVGHGAWCYVPPEDVNRLTLTQSTFGSRWGELKGWSTNLGTVALDTAAPYLLPSGVMRWTPSTAGSSLTASGTPGVPDVNLGCPALPPMPTTFSIWARAASGTATLTARVSACQADGSGATLVASPPVTVDTSGWAQLSVTAQPGDLGHDDTAAPWLLPQLLSSTTTPVLLSCPQLEFYGWPRPWALGGGIPRVNWVTNPGDLAIGAQLWQQGATMTLAQTLLGPATGS